MYTPKHFEEARVEALHGLIRAYPFATVVTRAASGLSANHLPFELAGDASLHGHVARGNELAQMDGAEVLLIFRGPDGYVSPNWYPSKHETGREVPTWNYAVAHVHGRLRVIDDTVWLRRLLETLTDHHEAGQPQPRKITDAPDDHIEKSLHGIVGLEVAIGVGSDPARAQAAHEDAHHACFIANSVNFPVRCEPRIVVGPGPGTGDQGPV
ncbi:MAG: FMN-binding negative transcriptional regulator [Rhodanobacter sp.]